MPKEKMATIQILKLYMNLTQITTLEQAQFILKAWWNRPNTISLLRKKHPEQEERIKNLWLTASERKKNALMIEVYFRENENPESVCLTLNS